VRLVEDEDFVAVASRRKTRSFTKFTCVVDAVMARRVDFDNVERTSPVT
jgi:hypothetical protein